MIKLNGPHLWLTYTAVHQVQLHLRDGFQLGQEKAMKLVKIYRALRSDDSNPFSFLHTFSFFLYFHMLSFSLNLVFNIHYYIIT